MEYIWKDIIGYEGIYQISNIGQVKSIYKGLRVLDYSSTYPSITLWNKNKHKKFSIHRLIAIHFIPNPDNKPQINHKDGNKQNFKIENLEWVTASENSKHAHETKLIVPKRGDNCSFSKINSEQVLEICNLLNSGKSTHEVSKIYGVTHSTISLIKRNKRWKHITKNINWNTVLKQKTKQKIINNLGQVFSSLTDAAKYYNMSIGNLSAQLNGKRKHVKGMKFKFLEDK